MGFGDMLSTGQSSMNWKEKPVTDPTMGALMIGGRSTRMGADKALIAKGATTLASHLARLLEKVIGTAPVLVGEGEIGDDCAGLGPGLKIESRAPVRFPDCSACSGVIQTTIFSSWPPISTPWMNPRSTGFWIRPGSKTGPRSGPGSRIDRLASRWPLSTEPRRVRCWTDAGGLAYAPCARG